MNPDVSVSADSLPQHPSELVLPRREAPKHGLRHHIAGFFLRLGGWTPVGDPPAVDKFIIVAAPHTWWWDGFWMMAFAWWWGVEIKWLVKSGAAWGPFGWLLRSVGAIPVDRSAPQGLVGTLCREFASQQSLIVSIPAEGTRARRQYWKSGFYHLARQAKVPVCLSVLDYGRGRGGFGPCFIPTGNVRADMDLIRSYYHDVKGRIPDRFTPPKLKEEDGLESSGGDP